MEIWRVEFEVQVDNDFLAEGDVFVAAKSKTAASKIAGRYITEECVYWDERIHGKRFTLGYPEVDTPEPDNVVWQEDVEGSDHLISTPYRDIEAKIST